MRDRITRRLEKRGDKYRGVLHVPGDKDYLPKDQARSYRVFYTRWYRDAELCREQLSGMRHSFGEVTV